MLHAGNQQLTPDHLSEDQCKAIIDRAAERGVKALSLTGGEPLLYKKSVARPLSVRCQSRNPLHPHRHKRLLFRDSGASGFTDRVKRAGSSLKCDAVEKFLDQHRFGRPLPPMKKCAVSRGDQGTGKGNPHLPPIRALSNRQPRHQPQPRGIMRHDLSRGIEPKTANGIRPSRGKCQ